MSRARSKKSARNAKKVALEAIYDVVYYVLAPRSAKNRPPTQSRTWRLSYNRTSIKDVGSCRRSAFRRLSDLTLQNFYHME